MAIKLKKVAEKLSKIRDDLTEKTEITPESEEILKSLIGDTLDMASED